MGTCEMRSLRTHSGVWQAVGILVMVVGALAIWAATLTSLVSALTIGTVLLVSGGAQLIAAMRDHGWANRGMHLLLAALEIAAGALLVLSPLQAAVTLSLLLAALFIAAGVLRLGAGFMGHAEGRGWMLLLGALNLLLGLIVVAGWPGSGLWFLGLAVGVALVMNGAAISAVAWNRGRI